MLYYKIIKLNCTIVSQKATEGKPKKSKAPEVAGGGIGKGLLGFRAFWELRDWGVPFRVQGSGLFT